MTDPKTTPAAPEAPVPLQEPSQDPRLVAQVPMDADTASREVKSVGVGGGVVAGVAAGAAVGTLVGGPLGAVVGGTAGAIVGALGGYAAVDATDPDYSYWRDNFRNQPGFVGDYNFEDDYSPAYRLGYQGRTRYAGKTWQDAEADLQRDWEALKGQSRLSWEQAKAAGRSAWERERG